MRDKEQSDPALQVLNDNGVQGSCWSCGDMVAAQFCKGCGKVQPAVPTDYFSFFGLPRKLNIDTAALEREMFSLSRRLHPDVYANASEEEQTWSLEQTSLLNDAYRTLRDPIGRTEYLLKVEGIRKQDAAQSNESKRPAVPPELLEEVFEINMQLEELRGNKKLGDEDYALTRELQQAQHDFEHKLGAIKQELHALWDEWDALISGEVASADDQRALCTRMLNLLNRRRYVQHLVNEIGEALNE
jgi:molecular chaperone HscB